jgi:hypothetical protein
MTPEELRRKQLADALEAQNKPAAPQPTQHHSTPSSSDPGGFGKVGTFKEGSGQTTEGITRVAGGVLTTGLSEIPIGGKSVGAQVGGAARKVDNKVQDFLRKIDPTNTSIGSANATGVDRAQNAVGGVGSKAADLARGLAANPTQAQMVAAPQVGPGSVIDRQGPIVADQVRGTTQQVQAGTAQMQQVDPAMIAALERMQAAQVARGDEQQLRARQIALADALQAQAAGTGPSLAEQQMQRANEQAIRAQMAQAASARGGNVAMAQRQAAQNIAGIQQENAARAAELRIQEQQAARQQLAGVLDSSRGQDIGIASTQAGLEQDAGKLNVSNSAAQAIEQARLQQQAALSNQQEFGTTSRFNTEQTLKAGLANQETDLRAATSDQGANLTAQTATATNNIAVDSTNAKALDEMRRFEADVGLKAQIANQAADLQARGMDNDQIAKLLGIEAQTLQAVLTSETARRGIEQDRLNKEAEAGKNMGGSILGTVAQVVAMCFPAGTPISLMAGGTKPIEEVEIGDMVAGGAVLGVRKQLVNERLYNVGGVLLTGSHAVIEGGRARAAKDVGEPAHVHVGLVFNLVTSTHRIFIHGIEFGDDTIDPATRYSAGGEGEWN